MEEWRPVVGYEKYYEVSSLGRVRRLGSNKVLSQSLGCQGRYLHVVLSVDGKSRTFNTHRIVAEAFLGPSNGLICCHNNGIKTDNRSDNLRWATQKENIGDKLSHGTMAMGENIGSNVWSHEQVGMVIRGEITSGQAKECWGMPQPTYSKIKTKATWSWHPAWQELSNP